MTSAENIFIKIHLNTNNITKLLNEKMISSKKSEISCLIRETRDELHRIQTLENKPIYMNKYKFYSDLLYEQINKFNNIQQNEKNILREQFYIMNPDLDENQVDQMIKNKQTFDFFGNKTITIHCDIAKEKYNDLLDLEASIEELHELFVDISNLIFGQGQMVNEISYNTEKTNINVAKGLEELKQASIHKKKAKKLMCNIL